MTKFKTPIVRHLTARYITAAIIATFILSPFAPGDSPLPPPYHQYAVFGTLERASSGPLNNFTIVLYGTAPGLTADGTYFRLAGSFRPTETDSPIAISDSLGSFFVRATSDIPLDSLRVGVLLYDRDEFLGPSFPPDTLNPRPVYVTNGGSISTDCSGCTEHATAPKPQLVGYVHTSQGILLILPF